MTKRVTANAPVPASEEKRPVGRPSSVVGKRTQVYLDDASKKTALRLGSGNVSEGIRTALRAATKLKINHDARVAAPKHKE